MFTKAELKKATRIIQKTARDNRVSEAKVRADIMEAIESGRSNPDPAVRAVWAELQFAGLKPTPEEFILWAAARIQNKER